VDDVLEAVRRRGAEDLTSYLAQVGEDVLGGALDRLLEANERGWRARFVSDALGGRILTRRTERLRALGPSAEALRDAPRVDVLDYPRVDGSTSTIPLARLVACRLLGSPYRWESGRALRDLTSAPFEGPASGGAIGVRSTPTRPPLPERAARGGIVADASAPGNERRARIVNGLLVRHTGTHTAWVNLIEGEADLILVARAPSPDERALAAARGVGLDARPVARDAFVFLVNRRNPVANLTMDQVRAIYTGAILDWKDVAGRPARIRAFQRDRNSGSQEIFLERVMGDVAPVVPHRDLLRDSMIGPFNAVAEDVDGIGFTVWYYERYMAALPEVGVLALDGVRPEPEAIQSGRYPLVTTVFVAVRADAPPDGAARRVRDWLLTEAGQAVVAESGYVPVP
jgi:phosphate transport system substrate-binding protein